MRLAALTAVSVLASSLVAQEQSYWIANRSSNDIMEVTPSGSVLRSIDMGTSLRSAHVAPDGKVWVVRFIQATFDIFDPATGSITSASHPLGSCYDIAFDAQGTAWVSGGTGVVHYADDGTLIQQYPLAQAAPLGITIDQSGSKWIAHRTVPGSVTQIDAAGVVTNFPVTGDNPVRPIADYRGLLMPSHIWVSCDDGGSLLELDANGNELNNYTMPLSTIGGIGPVFDRNGDIWVGSFSTAAGGTLFQVDETNGNILNTYTVGNSCNGLSVDTLGRVLVSQRITFSGVGPPCEVRRIDPATGAIEVVAQLQTATSSATGTGSGVSTPFQYALVVDQIGDTDGDGEINEQEILNGTSPIDASSNSAFSVDTTGITTIGNTASVNVQAAAAGIWVIGFSSAFVSPGVAVPGFGGLASIDLAALQGTTAGIGSANLPLTIANSASLQGIELFLQGVTVGATLDFQNTSGIVVW